MRGPRVHVYPLVLLLGVVLAVAGLVAGGGMKATFASGGGAESLSGDAAAVLRRVMSTRLEDVVTPELTVDLDLHRGILAGGGIDAKKALYPDRPGVCTTCATPGQPYNNRGCPGIYQCPH